MSDKNTLLTFENVSFGYKDGYRKLEILKEANVSFNEGTFYAIIGPSGSGKTTTLALAGALDVPQKGKVLYEGKDIRKIGMTKFRRDTVSMVFQSFNLISYMTALENVVMVMDISKTHKRERKKCALEILEKLGLTKEEATRNVRKLSGGQQQRVAIARAFAGNAKIILADEPTGNLDVQTSTEIVSLLKELATIYGKCVIIVTHSTEVSKEADVIMRFAKGGMQPIAI